MKPEPENLVNWMIRDEENWETACSVLRTIMKGKEADEYRREREVRNRGNIRRE